MTVHGGTKKEVSVVSPLLNEMLGLEPQTHYSKHLKPKKAMNIIMSYALSMEMNYFQYTELFSILNTLSSQGGCYTEVLLYNDHGFLK